MIPVACSDNLSRCSGSVTPCVVLFSPNGSSGFGELDLAPDDALCKSDAAACDDWLTQPYLVSKSKHGV